MTTSPLLILGAKPAGDGPPAALGAHPSSSHHRQAAFGEALGHALQAGTACGAAHASIGEGAIPGTVARTQATESKATAPGERRARRAERRLESAEKPAETSATPQPTAAAAAATSTGAATTTHHAFSASSNATASDPPARAAASKLAAVATAVGQLAAHAAAKSPMPAPGTDTGSAPHTTGASGTGSAGGSAHASATAATGAKARSAPARERPPDPDADHSDSAAAPAKLDTPTPAAAAEPRPVVRAAAAPIATASPIPLPPKGLDVQGAVLQSAAHLKVDTGTMGAIELHLRIRDGAVHLRVDGDVASTMQSRSGDLSRSLAGEGLKLAPIEVGSHDAGAALGGEGGRGFEERRDAWSEAADARQGGASSTAPGPSGQSESNAASGHGVHVEA